MKLTLSVDEKIPKEVRKVAQAMGKSLNQLVRDYLEQLTRPDRVTEEIAELGWLSTESQGDSQGWRFNCEELHKPS